jgi:hypothetical protein
MMKVHIKTHELLSTRDWCITKREHNEHKGLNAALAHLVLLCYFS